MTILENLYASIHNKDRNALKDTLIQAYEENVDINAYFPEKLHNGLSQVEEVALDFTQKPVLPPTLKQFNALHFAISKEWLEGIVMLKIAKADLNCSATLTLQTPTDHIDITMNMLDLVRQISSTTLRKQILHWLNASPDPRDWFQEDMIENLVDESTHRALFQNDIFEKQTEDALAKYQPLFQKHQWFEAPFLIRYWLQTNSIPTLNKIKNNWKSAHHALRTFLLNSCVIPYLSEPHSLNEQFSRFNQWQDYVRFLYTPASGYGSDQHSSFSSFWYSPFHENCPEWLKNKWQAAMRTQWLKAHPELTAEFFNTQFNLGSKTLIIQCPLLNKLDKLNQAIAAQNNQNGEDFHPAILAEVCRTQSLFPFSHLGSLLLPGYTETMQTGLTISLLNTLKKVFADQTLAISDLHQKSNLSEESRAAIEQLQEATKLLNPFANHTVHSLFLKQNLICELAKVIDEGSPEIKNTKKSRFHSSKKNIIKYTENAETNIQNWLTHKLIMALSSQMYPQQMIFPVPTYALRATDGQANPKNSDMKGSVSLETCTVPCFKTNVVSTPVFPSLVNLTPVIESFNKLTVSPRKRPKNI
ncbi:MAG: hypothetical protein U1E78_08720 [Gammaproteobacteria bacterium]